MTVQWKAVTGKAVVLPVLPGATHMISIVLVYSRHTFPGKEDLVGNDMKTSKTRNVPGLA